MKKIIVLLLVSVSLFAQDYPKDAIELLVGKELKVLPSSSDYVQKEGYYNFYKKQDLSYNSKLKAPYKDFLGKIFTLKSFEKKIGRLNSDISLELFDGKKSIYYEYNPEQMGSWIFEIIGGIVYPKDYWCKDIVKNYDKFTNKIKYTSPTDKHVYFLKEDGVTYIYLEAHGKTTSVGSKGVIILLNNGKIENPSALIDIKYDGDGWYTYTTLFALSESEIKLLSENYITDYRLYVYDFKLDNGSLYREYLKCLTKM